MFKIQREKKTARNTSTQCIMFVDIHALLRLLYTKILSTETMRNRWFHSVGSLSELKNANGEDKLPKKQTNILWAAPGNRMPFLARNYFIRVNHHPICHWSCFVEMRRINHLIAPENVWNVFVANSLIASSHAKHSHNYINSVWFKTTIGPIRSTERWPSQFWPADLPTFTNHHIPTFPKSCTARALFWLQ